MILLGVDPGSAHLGLVVVESMWPTLAVRHAWTLDVDPARLDLVVGMALDRADEAGAVRIIVEHAAWFARPGATPAGLMASQRAHETCHDIVRELQRRALVPVEVIGRQTWAHRVVPHHRGGVTDALVRAALPVLLEGADLLADVHQRDAAGAVLGYLLAPAPRAPRVAAQPCARVKKKRKRNRELVAAFIAARGAARAVRRAATGCSCPPGRPGRHPRDCPAYRALTYACRLCGGPRKGHVRGLPCPPLPA